LAVDPRLRERLIEKLRLSGSQVDRRITARARELVLPREQAAIALALEVGVSVSRFAEDEDLTAVRGAIAARTREPVVAEPRPEPTRRRRKGAAAKPRARPRPRKRGRKVFVVHGRDQAKRNAMFRFLRAIGLEPIEWSKAVKATKKAAPYIGEILEKAFEEAIAVVVLLTPDDQARLKAHLRKRSDPPYESTLTGQARANVLFEAGMAFGSHPDSTILVEVGDLRPFSDVGGRHVIRLTGRPESRQELVNRLEAAGCDVDTDGTLWLSEGDFGT
jgi:predicted nucleotide-binding protein